MSHSDVTVAVVPRERFSLTERALTNVCEQTSGTFKLVYVSAGVPPAIEKYLEDEADRRGFELISTKHYLSPNQARNLALGKVSTKYVAFLDNDALVTPTWLERLVQCAEETKAPVVGPLYMIGEFEEAIIHMAGGRLHFNEQDGRRVVFTDYRLADVALSSVQAPFRREACDFAEFHCMLLRTDFIERFGPLDERLLSLHEHIDVGCVARAAGESVYFDPSAVVTYIVPPPFSWSDLPYFMLRWNDDWNSSSIAHFCDKWSLSAARNLGDDDSDLNLEDSVIRWGRAHRRLASGLVMPTDWEVGVEAALDQARLMVALFQSVDRESFDLAIITVEGIEVEAAFRMSSHATLERLMDMMKRAEADRLSVLIRPAPPRRPNEPALLRIDVDQAGLSALQPHSLLTLKSSPGKYQVWLAVDRSNWRSASVVRRLVPASEGAEGSAKFSCLAGSLVLENEGRASDDFRRVTLCGGVTGKIATGMQLEETAAATYLWSAQLY